MYGDIYELEAVEGGREGEVEERKRETEREREGGGRKREKGAEYGQSECI